MLMLDLIRLDPEFDEGHLRRVGAVVGSQTAYLFDILQHYVGDRRRGS